MAKGDDVEITPMIICYQQHLACTVSWDTTTNMYAMQANLSLNIPGCTKRYIQPTFYKTKTLHGQ